MPRPRHQPACPPRRCARRGLAAVGPRALALALGLAAAASALAAPTGARAADAATYEEGRLARALDAAGLVPVADAAGRPIHRIHVLRHDVLADDEPFPTFFNAFHALTRDRVVRRELLFAPGDAWRQEAIDESARNLRGLGIFTIVRIVPVAPRPAPGDPPAPEGAVDAVVFTRDLWSLRAETSFQVTDGLLDQFALTLIERNLAGENKKAALRFELLPRTFSLGDTFEDDRLFGGPWALTQTFDLVFDRDDGRPEGSRGTLSVGLPLRDLRQPWGFEARVGYQDVVGRQLQGREILTYDVPETEAVEALPRVWDQAALSASLQARYQTGDALKHRLSVGFGGSDVHLAPRGAGLTADERAAFTRDVLPRQRRQLYPFASWSAFTPEYTTFVDLASFGLSEDVRLGPWGTAQLYLPLEAFGSSDDGLLYGLSAGFVAAPGGGLVDVYGELSGRLEQSEAIDQVYGVRVRGATPRLPFGRLVASAQLEARAHDSARTLVTLGGDNGLRGYPSQAFYAYGGHRARLNAELRTRPLVIASAHLGAVAFWDGGAVWSGGSAPTLHHSAGLGLRVLFPQFNRFTFRLDVAAPLDGEGFTVLATFGSLQAVPLTSAEDASLSQ